MKEATLRVFRGDSSGGQTVDYRVPVAPGMVVLMGLSTQSWDARYFGPVSQRCISGAATPLLIEGGAAAEVLRKKNLNSGSLHRKNTV